MIAEVDLFGIGRGTAGGVSGAGRNGVGAERSGWFRPAQRPVPSGADAVMLGAPVPMMPMPLWPAKGEADIPSVRRRGRPGLDAKLAVVVR